MWKWQVIQGLVAGRDTPGRNSCRCDFTPVWTQPSQCVDLGYNDLAQNPVTGGDDDNTLKFIGID